MANAETNPTTTRRFFLSAAPAAAVALSTTTAFASGDARLFGLCQSFWEINSQIDAMDDPIERLGKRYDELSPPRPKETRADLRAIIACPDIGYMTYVDNGLRYYSDAGIEFLRKWKPITQKLASDADDGDWTHIEVPDTKAQKVADRAVAAYDKWKAELQALSLIVGYDELCDKQMKLYDRLAEVREAAVAAPALTREGLAAKARILQFYYEGCEPESAGDHMMFSIMRDLLAGA